MTGPAWLALLTVGSLALAAWMTWVLHRRDLADWQAHVSAALAHVEVPQCEAAVDRRSPFGPVRRFGRLDDPARCPHLTPGQPASRVARFEDGDLQCCDRCFVAYGVGVGALYELLRRHGVREVQR